jgi:TPR repeat protein
VSSTSTPSNRDISAKAGQPNSELAKSESAPNRQNSRLAQLRAAAATGDVRAQLGLGVLLMSDENVRKDPVEAARWFAKVAERGDAEALFRLGQLHENGEGMPKNQQKAAVFYGRALAAGSAKASAKLKTVQSVSKTTPTKTDPTTTAAVEPAAGQPSGPPSPNPANDKPLNSTEIADLQRLLSRLDIASGEPDGVLGQRTVDAIKMYQRFAGLPVDGLPTATLLGDLKQVVGAMDTGQSTGK